MCINPILDLKSIISSLYSSLEQEKINLLKELVYGGFDSYFKFVKEHNSSLFLDTRYKDEICSYLDEIMINIIKNKIPIYGQRELREHLIIKALANNDMNNLASIIASASRTAVANTPNINHAIAEYFISNDYNDFYEMDDFDVVSYIAIEKTKKMNQKQLTIEF